MCTKTTVINIFYKECFSLFSEKKKLGLMLLRHATTNEVDGTDRESCSVENISISIVEHLCSITRHNSSSAV